VDDHKTRGSGEYDAAALVPSAIARVFEEQPVEVEQERHGERLVLLQAHDRVDRVAVAGELLLVAGWLRI
jgi:hypothetical protein